eukprot:TRINITY_DN4725_c0_g2_i1.p1 TRINITY_DN4725_c0_g2~~TRINITY_DN4725_c0_g2_i1.p1  ORF type:complete len:1254 (+),score=366.12 TRINITY_DN4725_c0_g2_i1:70-3831(+)
MPEQYDVVIVGGGPIGLSAAYEVMKESKQRKVLVLEQYKFVNQEGSSAGQSRQMRLQYTNTDMINMAQCADAQWQEFNKLAEEHGLPPVFYKEGSLWFGNSTVVSEEGGVAAAEKAMTEAGLPFDPLETGSAIEKAFPYMANLPESYSGFLQKDGGSVDLEGVQELLVKVLGTFPNVSLRDHHTVTNFTSTEEDGIHVHASLLDKTVQSFKANKLVIAGGAYVNRSILSDWGLQVPITTWEMSSTYFKIKDRSKVPTNTWYVFDEPDSPTAEDQKVYYGFTESASWDKPGYARVCPGWQDRTLSDPSERESDGSVTIKYTEDWVRDHMPGLDADDRTETTYCIIALPLDPKKEMYLDTLPGTIPNHKDIVLYTAGWAGKFVPTLGIWINKLLQNQPYDELNEYDSTCKENRGGTLEHRLLNDHFKVSWNYTFESHKNHKTAIKNDEELDVAIIGGGAAGLYAGMRMQVPEEHNGTETGKLPFAKTAIFEMSDRVGGRLWSIDMPNINVAAELGGMRYMSQQKLVDGYIKKFKEEGDLQPIDFPMGGSKETMFYLRGGRFYGDELKVDDKPASPSLQDKLRYFPEHGKKIEVTQETILTDLMDKILAEFGYEYTLELNPPVNGQSSVTITSLEDMDNAKLSTEQRSEVWDDIKRTVTYNFPNSPYEGQFLYDIGFWNLLLEMTDQETFNYCADSGGYYSNTLNWNAAEAFPYILGDFGADSKYKTIAGGFETLLKVPANKYMSYGGTITTRNALVSFEKVWCEKQNAPVYELLFKTPPEFLVDGAHPTMSKVRAKSIVLAMPRRALELLDQEMPFFTRYNPANERWRVDMQSVIPSPALKLLMVFDKPWWLSPGQELDTQIPHSITTLPLRQTYYFGVDETNNHGLLLASYNDMRTVSFWKGFEGDEAREQSFTCRCHDDIMKNPRLKAAHLQLPAYPIPPQRMVDVALEQLRTMHPPEVAARIGQPYAAAYRDWGSDPFGGGYHAWKSGFLVPDKQPYIRQPHCWDDVFVAGESYSTEQGWVEGAFTEMEKILEEKYGLPKPSFSKERYPWGNDDRCGKNPMQDMMLPLDVGLTIVPDAETLTFTAECEMKLVLSFRTWDFMLKTKRLSNMSLEVMQGSKKFPPTTLSWSGDILTVHAPRNCPFEAGQATLLFKYTGSMSHPGEGISENYQKTEPEYESFRYSGSCSKAVFPCWCSEGEVPAVFKLRIAVAEEHCEGPTKKTQEGKYTVFAPTEYLKCNRFWFGFSMPKPVVN